MIADHGSFARVHTDSDLEQRVRTVSNKFSDNIHIIANEPTLACYRLQEHVRRSLPVLVDRRISLARNDRTLEGRVFDLDYDVRAVKAIYPAESRFRTIQEMLKNCIFMKQELNKCAGDEQREKDKEIKMKRFSGSFDVQTTELLSAAASTGDIRSSPLTIGTPERTGSLRGSPRDRPKSSVYYRISTPTK